MTNVQALFFITNELFQLGVSKKSQAYDILFDQALEASDVLTKKELKIFIQEWIDYLPNRYFEV